MADADVRSEVGRLASVLVHRPGLELERITPANKDELLFDELLWVERAQEEHDAFVGVLQAAGVEVLRLADLLVEVLRDDELARRTVAEHVTDRSCGPALIERVRGWLADLPPDRLVAHLIGGVALAEVGGGNSLVARAQRRRGGWATRQELLLQPLPNTVFTRDSSAWIGRGAVLSPMNRLVRRRETRLLQLVYSQHPRFARAPVWYGDEPVEYFPATVEGGDLLMAGEQGLVIGLSERTSPPGAEALAARLFAARVVERILVVELPRARTTMHLDTVVAMVDTDAFLLYPRLRRTVDCVRLTPGADGRLRVEEGGDLGKELAWVAGLDAVREIEPALDSVPAEREQWNDANNVLTLWPGEVVAYERNVATNATLEEAGVTVHRIPSYELPRGRGGPRCMTCPVRRAAIS